LILLLKPAALQAALQVGRPSDQEQEALARLMRIWREAAKALLQELQLEVSQWLAEQEDEFV